MAEHKVYLRDLNPLITCILCGGYLIDATTIPECLHTFCKSCILKHLQEHTRCPNCDKEIHQSHPTQYISYDRTMQDIVYKLVPNLYKGIFYFAKYCVAFVKRSCQFLEEMKRREEFCKKNNIPFDNPLNLNTENKDKPVNAVVNNDHANDEPIAIVLNSISTPPLDFTCKYLIVSIQATVTHLKKFIALKLFQDQERFQEIDVLCNNELMGKDHSLNFILRTRWRSKQNMIDSDNCQQRTIWNHDRYVEKLQELAQNLPSDVKSYFNDELLDNLAKALTDETVFLIVAELKEIQVMTEKALFTEREVLRKEREVGRKTVGIDLQKYDEQSGKLLADKDTYIIHELDKLVEQQQMTLEKAGIPGFFVTTDPEYQKIQLSVLEFVSLLEFERRLL
uniref:RING-type domain-containing protein n=1 Tax=Romanomermis culicivorax TaxID=13658 RepID=A0A915JZY6_ROMCU